MVEPDALSLYLYRGAHYAMPTSADHANTIIMTGYPAGLKENSLIFTVAEATSVLS